MMGRDWDELTTNLEMGFNKHLAGCYVFIFYVF